METSAGTLVKPYARELRTMPRRISAALWARVACRLGIDSAIHMVGEYMLRNANTPNRIISNRDFANVLTQYRVVHCRMGRPRYIVQIVLALTLFRTPR